MYKETAGEGLSLMTIRSFKPHLNPMRLSVRPYRGKMTPDEPLDDNMFITANFRAKQADTESRSQDRI